MFVNHINKSIIAIFVCFISLKRKKKASNLSMRFVFGFGGGRGLLLILPYCVSSPAAQAGGFCALSNTFQF